MLRVVLPAYAGMIHHDLIGTFTHYLCSPRMRG